MDENKHIYLGTLEHGTEVAVNTTPPKEEATQMLDRCLEVFGFRTTVISQEEFEALSKMEDCNLIVNH